MAVSRGLIISLGVSALSCTLLFLYFRNKISTIERKVDVMFDLIQNHESERQPMMQYMPQQMAPSSHDSQNNDMSANRNDDLIDVSDDDLSDDSREVSDDEDEEYSDNEDSKISLNNTETIPLSDDDIKKIVVPLTVENINLEENPLEEITDSLDEIEDDDDDDDDDENKQNTSVALGDVIEVVKTEPEQQADDNDVEGGDEVEDNDDEEGDDEVESDDDDDEEEDEINYSKLKVSELKALAKEKGLTNYKSLKKAPLVELLKSSE